jgi:general stress protein 26
MMSQEKISYEELEKEIIEIIRNRPLKIIATSSGDSVTAREVRFCSDGLNMFFITDNRSRKYEQIKTNPNVAVAVGNLARARSRALRALILESKF